MERSAAAPRYLRAGRGRRVREAGQGEARAVPPSPLHSGPAAGTKGAGLPQGTLCGKLVSRFRKAAQTPHLSPCSLGQAC